MVGDMPFERAVAKWEGVTELSPTSSQQERTGNAPN